MPKKTSSNHCFFLGLKNRLIVFKKGWDPDEVGSAPLLGVAKPVFIGHGSTDRKSINSAIVQIENCLKKNVFHKIEEQMQGMG